MLLDRILFGLLFLLMLAGWGLWGAVLFLADPALLVGRFFFFALLFTAVLCTSTVVAYLASYRFFALRRNQGNLGRALLQGLPAAALLSAGLWLQSQHILNWTSVAILLFIFAVLEYSLLPRKSAQGED